MGAAGFMSLNPYTNSSSYIFVDGTSPFIILQNKQKLISLKSKSKAYPP